MNRLLLALLLIAGLLAPDVAARDVATEDHPPAGVRWTAAVVPVTIYGDPAHYPVHAQAWADLAAALPNGWPALPTSYGGALGCEAAFALVRAEPFIVTCEDSALADTQGISGWAALQWDGDVMQYAHITYDAGYAASAGIVCHEGMHALGVTTDHYGSIPTDSCVYGTRETPGPYDRWMLTLLYGGDPTAEPPTDDEPVAKAKKCKKKDGKKARKRCKRRAGR